MRGQITGIIAVLLGITLLATFGIYTTQTFSDVAQNRQAISSCTAITQSGYYYLTKDLSGAPLTERKYDGNPFTHVPEPKSCIVITASDVTLDCKGHKIIIPKGRKYRGISVGKFGKNLYNVVIKNCKIVRQDSAQVPSTECGGLLIVNSAGRGRSQVTCKSTTCNGGKCCYEAIGYDVNGNVKEHRIVYGCKHA